MRVGEVLDSDGEKITCLQSSSSGGPFVFEMALAPGKRGPPSHSHDEGDELIEVLEGEIVFEVSGEERLLKAGESLRLTPGDAHTFWNPSKTTTVRCRVVHGPRFERAMGQLAGGGSGFARLAMFLTYVDPGASRMASPLVRFFLRAVALAGKINGVTPHV